MANIIAFIIGGVALLLAIPAFIPLLGIFNWLILPIAALGATFGVFSRHRSGLIFCVGVMAFCAFRLFLGGGLL